MLIYFGNGVYINSKHVVIYTLVGEDKIILSLSGGQHLTADNLPNGNDSMNILHNLIHAKEDGRDVFDISNESRYPDY